MPKRSKREVYSQVNKTIGKKTMSAITRFMKGVNPKLMGLKQDKEYLERNLNVVIYKYIKNIGYAQLVKDTNKWIGFSYHSLNENSKKIMDCLGFWGNAQIINGDKDLWNKNAEFVRKPKILSNVNLWIDSTDIAMAEKFKNAADHPYYSIKEKCVARRYTLMNDGLGIVRWLSFGYSPKYYDAHYIEANKQTLEKNFNGAIILGDSHYASARKIRELNLLLI